MSDHHPDVYQASSGIWFADCPEHGISGWGYNEAQARERRDEHQRGHVERRAS